MHAATHSAVIAIAFAAICCGGTPAAPGTDTVLAHAQGWLCNAGPSAVVTCAAQHITDTFARVTVRAPFLGTLRLEVVHRNLDYQEYVNRSLRCGGMPRRLDPVESRNDQPPPSWFAPILGTNWPASTDSYEFSVDADDFCEATLTVDLRSPPYSPYDVTIVITPAG